MSRPTWDPGRLGRGCAHGAVTLCGGPFQALALAAPPPSPGPATPPDRSGGLGVVRVRSPLLAESLLSSLPPATEMFHFAGSRARRPIWFGRGRPPRGGRVAPFGHPRIEGRMRLPGDFRSLPRPSSPAAAKASAARPYSLDAKGVPAGLARVQRAAAAAPACFLTKKRRRAEPSSARDFTIRRNESAPRGIETRGGRSLLGGRPRESPPMGRSRASFPVRCQRSRAGRGRPAVKWWAHMDSDHGPRPYQRRALTS